MNAVKQLILDAIASLHRSHSRYDLDGALAALEAIHARVHLAIQDLREQQADRLAEEQMASEGAPVHVQHA